MNIYARDRCLRAAESSCSGATTRRVVAMSKEDVPGIARSVRYSDPNGALMPKPSRTWSTAQRVIYARFTSSRRSNYCRRCNYAARRDRA